MKFILLEAADWISADGSMVGREAFARDWNETVKRGGRRSDVAARWGVSEQVASNRASLLAKMGFRMQNFSGHKGVKASPTGEQSPQRTFMRTIDPKNVIDAFRNVGGDFDALAKELGLTRSEAYGLVKRLEISHPEIAVLKRGRGRPKRQGGPSVEEFARLWNSSASRGEAYLKIGQAYPMLTKTDAKGQTRYDAINQMAWKINRSNPELLDKLPTSRWIIQQQSGAPATEGEEGEDFSDIFGGGEEDVPTAQEPEQEEDPWAEKTEPGPEPSFEEEPPAHEPEAPRARKEPSLTDSEREFIAVYNASESQKEAYKKLKRLGWSFGRPEGKGREAVSGLADFKDRVKALRARGAELKKHRRPSQHDED